MDETRKEKKREKDPNRAQSGVINELVSVVRSVLTFSLF
jgi:hypothetical protein